MTDSIEDCIFCNIVNKTINSSIVFENDELMVVNDILPQAPVNLLVFPKEHISSVNALTEDHRTLIGNMILAAKDQAAKRGIAESGYKLVFNVGKDGGQAVHHLDLHLLGGKLLPE